MTSTPVSPIALPEMFGPYRILRPLGKGGMGTVYLAFDTRLDREVALKICHVSENTTALERFRREAKAAATLSHPNLCPVYEYDVRDGIAYLTMAFIEGQTLREVLAERGTLPPDEAVRMVVKLARAMQSAHDAGVIHRDLKPANIALNRKGEPIILDFGLARQTDEAATRVTRPGMFVGTLSYMAPEQLDDAVGALGPRSDIYSLGVILYELLTGKVPFKGPIAAMVFKVIHVEPEPPSQRNPAVDDELEAVCLKALAKNPANRFPSMIDFAEALSDSAPTVENDAGSLLVSDVVFTDPIPEPAPLSVAERISTPDTAPQRVPRARNWTAVVVILFGLAVLPLGVALWRFFVGPPVDPVVNTESIPEPFNPGDGPPPPPKPDTVRRALAVFPPVVPPAYAALRFPAVAAKRPDLLLPYDSFVYGRDLQMIYLAPGTFQMGSTPEELDLVKPRKDETRHRVRLTRGFHMSATLVTQRQWKAVMGQDNNPSEFKGDDLPVDNVSWNDCRDFCLALSLREGRPYRLPREAEWEYAARAGTTTPFWTGESIGTKQANFNGNFPYRLTDEMGGYEGRTTPVTRFTANPWKLYDMHGNLQQWCEDRYGDYPKQDVEDPKGPANGTTRVLRGGSWQQSAAGCRSASREDGEPTLRFKTYGFRVVVPGCVPKPQPITEAIPQAVSSYAP